MDEMVEMDQMDQMEGEIGETDNITELQWVENEKKNENIEILG